MCKYNVGDNPHWIVNQQLQQQIKEIDLGFVGFLHVIKKQISWIASHNKHIFQPRVDKKHKQRHPPNPPAKTNPRIAPNNQFRLVVPYSAFVQSPTNPAPPKNHGISFEQPDRENLNKYKEKF